MAHLRYLSYLKVVGIILVVVGHSLHEYPGTQEQVWLFRFIYSFHMPLFVFASGFAMSYSVMMRSRGDGYGTFLLKKVKRLLVPFFVLNGIAFLPRVLFNSFADDKIELSSGQFIKSLFYSDELSIIFFWFLPMCFLCTCLTYLPLRYVGDSSRWKGLLSVLLLCIALLTRYTDLGPETRFFSLWEFSNLYLYFALGIIAGMYFKTLERVPWSSVWLLVLLSVVTVSLFEMTEIYGGYGIWGVLCACSGIAAVISLSHLLVQRNITLLDHLCDATYMIFLLSWFIHTVTQQILHHFTDFPWWCYTALSIVCAVYVPYAVLLFLRFGDNLKRTKRTLLFILGH
ncbi:MAG: acyltransferase [Pseudoflavonifractor sp.]|nr:acyltransferase [Pseudoflavonifractor sp.]